MRTTKKHPLSVEYLRSRVSYDPATGRFTWLPHPGKANGNRAWDKQWAGRPVSRRIIIHPNNPRRPYVLVRLLNCWYSEHRLAWLYTYGQWPADELDHRDSDATNNRIANLREATHGQNQNNRGPMRNNRLGVKGVYYRPNQSARRPYRAQIHVPNSGKTKHIGCYATAEEASAAFKEWADRFHGEFAHHNL